MHGLLLFLFSLFVPAPDDEGNSSLMKAIFPFILLADFPKSSQYT